jgi:hypothetical protein
MGANVFNLGSMEDDPHPFLIEPAFEWLAMVQPADLDHKLRLATYFLRAAKNYREVKKNMEAFALIEVEKLGKTITGCKAGFRSIANYL